ncbi:MAG: hypothetical protein LBS36_03350 [Oscillospiraceae bacterium]|jgi:hypothetical protein|nr:hypothetical protein [Oscillospiraceae bacterium]
MVVKTLEELNKVLRKKITESLKADVFESIKEVEKKHINSDIYDVYEPTWYTRRKSNGGLIDDSNFICDIDESALSLNVINVTPPNESVLGTPYDSSNKTALLSWIESGSVPNIFNNNDYAWMHPRPFVKNSIDDLLINKQHIKILKEGLLKRGLRVK